MLEKAFNLALQAHNGQVDKNGKAFILHPYTVSEMVSSEELKTVAILHDVVEDTPVTIRRIYEEFPHKIAEAVESITRNDGEVYMDYIKRCSRNELARVVKVCDLGHNLLPERRLPGNSDSMRKRYEKALQYLTDPCDEPDPYEDMIAGFYAWAKGCI